MKIDLSVAAENDVPHCETVGQLTREWVKIHCMKAAFVTSLQENIHNPVGFFLGILFQLDTVFVPER